MPRGTCAECGLEGLGPGLDEDEAFLCCDCDIELQAYSSKERRDPGAAALARRSLGGEISAGLVLAQFQPNQSGTIELYTDPKQQVFAGLGAQLWPASESLARYLATWLDANDAAERHQLSSVLELGAGCGCVGISLWHSLGRQRRVCLTDVHRLCPLMELNRDRVVGASSSWADPVVIPIVRPLRWGVANDLADFTSEVWDVVIGSDVCYNEDKVEPLLTTILVLRPTFGAVLALSLCHIRGPGAWALKECCQAQGWLWSELERDVASDGKEVLLVHLALPKETATE